MSPDGDYVPKGPLPGGAFRVTPAEEVKALVTIETAERLVRRARRYLSNPEIRDLLSVSTRKASKR